MKETPFDLKHPDMRVLDELGLRLPGLRDTRRLASASHIEGPTSIISTVSPGALIDVGAFCNLSGGSINNVRFGRYCSVASGVVVGPHEHPTDWLTTSRTAYYPEVNGWDALVAPDQAEAIKTGLRSFTGTCPVTEVGPDVWIGQGAFIKAGVSIGTGSIIGARATVLRDVPPYSVVVGTPGRVIRMRFPEPLVERLLTIAWWRFSIYDLFAAPFDNVARAVDAIEDLVASGLALPFEGPMVTPEDLANPEALVARLKARFRPTALALAS